ncbi:MAG: hypothetical protein K6G73_01305 [Marinilabiliaceae bacterium]|nr:hypothetical protein [Marinilabiliaceae bacterium]
MKSKIVIAAIIIICVSIVIVAACFEKALNDEPTFRTICEFKISDKDVSVVAIIPELMINDVVTRVDVNDEFSRTYIGYDSVVSLYVNADSMCLILSNSQHSDKVDTIYLSLNNYR